MEHSDLRAVAPVAPYMTYSLWRLYVGVPEYIIVETVRSYFDAATILPARGLWRGLTEESSVIEILTPEDADVGHQTARVQALATALAERGRQESVLVTVQRGVAARFVTVEKKQAADVLAA